MMNATSITNTNVWIGNWDGFSGSDVNQWCADMETTVTNFSWSFSSPSNGSQTSVDRNHDYWGKNFPYTLVVASAGNGGNFAENKGYNGLVVGAIDDKATLSPADDQIAGFSAWKNPAGSFGDYELPHLVAPGVNVDSANLTNRTGTSFSAPQVSGTALLVRSVDIATYTFWPEMLRSTILATAVRNVDGGAITRLWAGGSPNFVDHKDGSGVLSASGAVLLATPINYRFPGSAGAANGRFRKTLNFANDFFPGGSGKDVWNMTASLTSGRMRVVIVWTSTPTCSSPGVCSSNTLDGDLDLEVRRTSSPPDVVCTSAAVDSSWEICDFPASAGQTFDGRAIRRSNAASTTYFSIAWHNY
jgi:hypothetical protein